MYTFFFVCLLELKDDDTMNAAHFDHEQLLWLIRKWISLKDAAAIVDVPSKDNSFLLGFAICASFAPLWSLVHLGKFFENVFQLLWKQHNIFSLTIFDWPFRTVKNCKFKYLTRFLLFANWFVLIRQIRYLHNIRNHLLSLIWKLGAAFSFELGWKQAFGGRATSWNSI